MSTHKEKAEKWIDEYEGGYHRSGNGPMLTALKAVIHVGLAILEELQKPEPPETVSAAEARQILEDILGPGTFTTTPLDDIK